MPDAESRAARNRITTDPASDSAPEGSRLPDRSAAESDAGLTSRSIAIPRGQSITDCAGNSLVTRGLQDIAELRAREELSACMAAMAAAEKAADIALEEFVALQIKKGLISDPEPESTAAESPEPTPPPPAPPADPSPDWWREQT